MKIIIRGVNIAPKIELLPDEESVLQLYEEIRDKAPFGEESIDQFNARNESLLSAMLRVFNLNDAETVDDQEGTESPFVVPSLLVYR